MENWFHPDDVSKDSAKRKEIRDIIFARMKERGSVLPSGFKLPVLDFTPSPTPKPHFHDVSNSTNRQSSSNPSYLPNRFHPNAPHNSPKPSTSQNQPKNPNPSLKFPNYLNRNNSRYNSHLYYDDHNEDSDEESIESIDEDVNRQFNENDHYDEDFREPYEEDEEEYDDEELAVIQQQREFLAEMVESPEHEDDEEETLE